MDSNKNNNDLAAIDEIIKISNANFPSDDSDPDYDENWGPARFFDNDDFVEWEEVETDELKEKRVVTLKLVNTELEEYPSSIGQLDALEFLVLDKAFSFQISPREIQFSFANLIKLKTLVIKNMSFINFVDAINKISQLPQITRLNISRNKIEELPESLSKLENLTHLDLGYNNLSDIPDFFIKFSNLKSLTLAVNMDLDDIVEAKLEKMLPNASVWWS